MRAGFVLLSAALLAAAGAPRAHGQTVSDIAGRGQCSTAGLEGLSAQLVEAHLCMFPDQVAELTSPNITATSNRVHLLVTTETRDALEAAAAQVPLKVNSAFRTLVDQYVLHHSGGCGVAAAPGASNHQSGLAVDLANWSSVVGVMGSAGCSHPLPNTDPVHFNCPGPDLRSASVLVFQRVWNANHPEDAIAEDGSYGPATAARVAAAPAGGFPSNGCAIAAQEPLPDLPAPAADDGSAAGPKMEPDVHGELEGGCAVSPAARPRGAFGLWLLIGVAGWIARRRR